MTLEKKDSLGSVGTVSSQLVWGSLPSRCSSDNGCCRRWLVMSVSRNADSSSSEERRCPCAVAGDERRLDDVSALSGGECRLVDSESGPAATREQAVLFHEHEPLLLHHVRDKSKPNRTHLLIGPDPVRRRDRVQVGDRLRLLAVPARPIAHGAPISGTPDGGSLARLVTLDGDYVDASIAGGGEDGQVARVRGDDLVAVVS